MINDKWSMINDKWLMVIDVAGLFWQNWNSVVLSGGWVRSGGATWSRASTYIIFKRFGNRFSFVDKIVVVGNFLGSCTVNALGM